jgi:hypothetical protein
VLAERDGLTSWELFFLDRPGPVVERAEGTLLRVGRFGDDSLEGFGELVAEGPRFGSDFFIGGMEDVDVSRAGWDVLAAVCSLVGAAAVMSTGSAVSWLAPVMGVKRLSSIVEAVLASAWKEESTSNGAAHRTNGDQSGPCLGVQYPGFGSSERRASAGEGET